jgi:hypothetical protein
MPIFNIQNKKNVFSSCNSSLLKVINRRGLGLETAVQPVDKYVFSGRMNGTG